MLSASPTDHLNDWKTLEEAAEILKCSKRTILRMAEQKRIQRVLRRVPGRKPMPVFNPSDIEAIRTKTVEIEPFPVAKEVERQALAPQTRQRGIDLLAQLFNERSAAAPRVPLERKIFLTLIEASEYSGMPKSWLLQKIKQNELTAIKARGWRIRRSEIDNL